MILTAITFIKSLTIIQMIVWWSLIGIFPYQLTFLRMMFKENPKQLRPIHYLQSLPFGIIIIFSVISAGLMIKYKIITLSHNTEIKNDKK